MTVPSSPNRIGECSEPARSESVESPRTEVRNSWRPHGRFPRVTPPRCQHLDDFSCDVVDKLTTIAARTYRIRCIADGAAFHLCSVRLKFLAPDSPTRIDVLVRRIRAGYLDTPGLGLTVDEAQCLWQLDQTECEALLAAFVAVGFLHRSRGGVFTRAGSATAVA
jgi:hypothetical protein